MPIKFAVKIVRLNVYVIIASPMTLAFTHNCLKHDKNVICSLIVIFRTIFKLWHTNVACMVAYIVPTHTHLDDLDLTQGHSGLAEENIQL